MIQCKILPVDIEVVLGSKSKDQREIIPYIYDFNESSIYNANQENIAFLLAKSMFYKNGKYYFPNHKNPYYNSFQTGFILSQPPEHQLLASSILTEYNKFFK